MNTIINDIRTHYDADVEIYGSAATGLSLPDSDVDLLIVSK